MALMLPASRASSRGTLPRNTRAPRILAYLPSRDVEVFDEWQERTMATAQHAPERDGAQSSVQRWQTACSCCTSGHSDATYEEALACKNAGADIFVHTSITARAAFTP